MEMSDGFVQFLQKYKNVDDLIENLFLKSLIDSYSRVIHIENLSKLHEPKIRNKFQYDLLNSNNLIKDIIEKGYLTFTAENQIINKEKEIKRTDIEFIINGLIKYVVECKKMKGISKTQYIDNGISRFINHDYIGENEKYAGMCSFIVGGDIENIMKGTKDRLKQYHFLKINNNNICDFKSSFSSSHSKVNNEDILIHHLFFDIKERNTRA